MRETRKMREKRKMREMRERREMCERNARDARDARDVREEHTHRGVFVRAPTASHVFQCMIGRAKERNTNKRKGGIMRKVERCVGARCSAGGSSGRRADDQRSTDLRQRSFSYL